MLAFCRLTCYKHLRCSKINTSGYGFFYSVRAGCSKAESNFFLPRRSPSSRGCGTAKIQPAGDGHCLHLQTHFREDRCTQFRVIMVTDTQTHPQTESITIHRAAASAQCNEHNRPRWKKHKQSTQHSNACVNRNVFQFFFLLKGPLWLRFACVVVKKYLWSTFHACRRTSEQAKRRCVQLLVSLPTASELFLEWGRRGEARSAESGDGVLQFLGRWQPAPPHQGVCGSAKALHPLTALPQTP